MMHVILQTVVSSGHVGCCFQGRVVAATSCQIGSHQHYYSQMRNKQALLRVHVTCTGKQFWADRTLCGSVKPHCNQTKSVHVTP